MVKPLEKIVNRGLRAASDDPLTSVEVSTPEDIERQTCNLFRGERKTKVVFFLQITPNQFSDPSNILFGKPEPFLELFIRYFKPIRAISIPP